MPRKKDPEKVKREQELAEFIARMKKRKEEEEYEKAHRIVLGAPRRPRKWATATEPPTILNEDGSVKMVEPEWYVDENGREVQLITIDTDWSLVDRYYAHESRYKYFDPPETKKVLVPESNKKPKPSVMKKSNSKIARKPLLPGEKKRDRHVEKLMRETEEREEKIKSGRVIIARPSFLWKD